MPNNPEAWDGQQQSNFEDWSFREWHVALDEGGKNTNPVTAENIFLGAGPARLKQVGGNIRQNVFPLGMVQQAMVGQQKMVQQVREIGSRRSYIISSYATGNLSLNRVMYSHSSVLRALTLANDDFENDIDNPAGARPHEAFSDDQSNVAEQTAKRSLYSNLQSELFDRPIGLFFYMLDQRNQPYGAFYCEDCMVQNHNFSVQSRSVQLAEQINMMFDRVQPVEVHTGN